MIISDLSKVVIDLDYSQWVWMNFNEFQWILLSLTNFDNKEIHFY